LAQKKDGSIIDGEGQKSIFQSLKTNQSLKSLNICNHFLFFKILCLNIMSFPANWKIESDSFNYLMDSLKQNATLAELTMSFLSKFILFFRFLIKKKNSR